MSDGFTITELRLGWIEARAGDTVIAVAEQDVLSGRWRVRLIDTAEPDILDSTVEFWCDSRLHLERVIRFHARSLARGCAAVGGEQP